MKILLTGASSFTGFWFAKKLIEQGHQVTCTMTQKSQEKYRGTKAEQRVHQLPPEANLVYSTEFGDENFCALLQQGFDVVGLHGASIPDYRSADFDVGSALQKNLFQVQKVFSILSQLKIAVLFTGTYFEQNEGSGTEAVSPYGFAKGLISEAFMYYGHRYNVPTSKFVVPNPFGPLEDKKFTSFLIDCWKKKQSAEVKTPLYVRDNIPVQLLAECYAQAIAAPVPGIFRPSGHCETQGEFTHRFAKEMRLRSDLKCEVKLFNQTDFPEPKVRVNKDPALKIFPQFSEENAWDELAKFYEL